MAVCADVPRACFSPSVPCRGTCAYILLLLVAVFERNYYDLYVAYSNCSVLHVALPVPTYCDVMEVALSNVIAST